MEPKKHEYIDSLRGIAILLVILVHIWQYNPDIVPLLSDTVIQFMVCGIYGVQLFFVVSAFTLMLSYQNRKNEKHATRNFFIRRFFRIAPMYYLAILYFTIHIFLKFNISDIDWSNFPFKGLISSILFANGLFPAWINGYVPGGWSITVEFMFYFSLPFLCKFVNNINRSFIFLLISLIGAMFLNNMLKGSSFDKYDFLYYYFPNQLCVFALGIFSYWIKEQQVKNIKGESILLLIFVLILSYFIPFPSQFIFSVAFFFLLLVSRKYKYKFLSNNILTTIGKYSFSLYLVHFAVLELSGILLDTKHIIDVYDRTTATINLSLFYVAILIVSLIISYITYNLIEVPGQNLGRKLIKKLDTKIN